MSDDLSREDLAPHFADRVYTQNYSDPPLIKGVQLFQLKNFVSEDGDFSELLRIDDNGRVLDIHEFKLRQLNRSRVLGRVVKAWHLHLAQNELWYVPPESHLLVGLLDLRKSSETKEVTMRLILGGGQSGLLYIPKGVAHGSMNLLDTPAIIWYFIDRLFDQRRNDEHRLPWDILGADFWQYKRD